MEHLSQGLWSQCPGAASWLSLGTTMVTPDTSFLLRTHNRLIFCPSTLSLCGHPLQSPCKVHFQQIPLQLLTPNLRLQRLQNCGKEICNIFKSPSNRPAKKVCFPSVSPWLFEDKIHFLAQNKHRILKPEKKEVEGNEHSRDLSLSRSLCLDCLTTHTICPSPLNFENINYCWVINYSCCLVIN